MALTRPTLAGRAGYDPYGYGPGVSAPFGTSARYTGEHHGQDDFWMNATSAAKYGTTTAKSKYVFPVVNGPVHHDDSAGLGNGAWQQIDSTHRFYFWHLSKRLIGDGVVGDTSHALGIMGDSGWAAAPGQIHLHSEVRKAPYEASDRIDPEPFFHGSSTAGGVRVGSLLTLTQAKELSGWLGRTYNSAQYWTDVQTRGRAGGVYPSPKYVIDGKPGPQTFKAEKFLWDENLAPEPNERYVKAGADLNRRAEPTSKSKDVGTVKANTKVALLYWTTGETVEKLDAWVTDDPERESWLWLGGFTSVSLANIPEWVEPTPEPEPTEPTPEPEPEVPVEPEPEAPEEPKVPPTEATPNWVIRLIQAIVQALAKFLSGSAQK